MAIAAILTGCAGNNTSSSVSAPGEAMTSTTRTLDAGAALMQSRPPIDALNAYLDGFHFYNGNMGMQMEAHHYCSHLNEEVIQCVIYDGNRKDAKLMGVEYIISEPLFSQLPQTEKALWHSHVHEVRSGQLVAPGIPEIAEHALMQKLVHTYGKTWHTWHTDLNKNLPLGVPQLMMGFTADGQVKPELVQERDKRFDINSAEKRQQRTDISAPAVDAGADAWGKGKVIQIEDPTQSSHH
ncbi:OBAP family protein [Pseudomonas sp. PB3P13]